MEHDASAKQCEATEEVILVHGTFASSQDDEGKGWWQIGSPAHNDLQSRLPPNVSLASEGNLFRWSGENTERARSKAASQLLHFLKPYEESGKRYHLVGHSHGGSVIWAALRQSTARHKPLDHLKSWSTVGTPFLHHRSRSPWGAANIAYMMLAGLLLYPAARAFWALVKLPYDVVAGQFDGGVMIQPDSEASVVSLIIRTPILKGLELVGVGRTETADGIRLGSFDASSGESPAHFLFGTLEGWLIVGAILLFGYITLLLGSFFLSPVSEGIRIRWEKRLEQRAFSDYGQRWLGIWTEDDEAINGLRATMELTVSFVGNLVLRERIFVSDMISLPWRPLYRLAAPFYNRLLRPMLDSKIQEIVVKTAQGNDRPAARVVAVSPHPILPSPAAAAPALPSELRDKIRSRADHHANDLGPKLRVLLAQPSLTAGLESFSNELSGRELVHTSYFDHVEVLDLLSMNMGQSEGKRRPRRASTSPAMSNWFKEFKRRQGAPDDDSRNQPPRIAA